MITVSNSEASKLSRISRLPEAIGKVVVIDGEEYKVVDNDQLTVVTYEKIIMKPLQTTLQAALKQSESEELALGYYCKKRDTIFVCKSGKIIERLAGWQMPYFLDKYVKGEG